MGQQAAVTGMDCPGTGKVRALKAARFAVIHLGMCSLHPDKTHVYVSTQFVELHQRSVGMWGSQWGVDFIPRWLTALSFCSHGPLTQTNCCQPGPLKSMEVLLLASMG